MYSPHTPVRPSTAVHFFFIILSPNGHTRGGQPCPVPGLTQYVVSGACILHRRKLRREEEERGREGGRQRGREGRQSRERKREGGRRGRGEEEREEWLVLLQL